MRDFDVLGPLGGGAFGSVFKVRRREDGKIYALKRVNIGKMSKKEVEDTLNEVRFLASVRHQNIVGYFESFLDKGDKEICIIMEFCGCGDLSSKVERYRKRRQYIDENVIWAYLVQCMSALYHLHKAGVMHRDIKPANCFLGQDGSVKVGDMNVSKRIKGNGMMQTQIGTPYYMSPEIWANRPYDTSSDIWATGCLIYELMALRPPFLGDSFPELRRNVRSGRYPALPRNFSSSLKQFVARMLSLNPRDRPSAEDLLNDPEVRRHVKFTDALAPNDEAGDRIMGTIRVPRNRRGLDVRLPKACYPDARPNSPHAWPMADTKREAAIQESARNRARSAPETPLAERAARAGAPNPGRGFNNPLPINPRGSAMAARQAAAGHQVADRQRRVNPQISSANENHRGGLERIPTDARQRAGRMKPIRENSVIDRLPNAGNNAKPRKAQHPYKRGARFGGRGRNGPAPKWWG